MVDHVKVLATLDVDGDGIIDEDEWVSQLELLPLLKHAIEAAVDPHTGKLRGYEGSGSASAPPPDTPSGLAAMTEEGDDEEEEDA